MTDPFKFSPVSLRRLELVHPDLLRVIHAALDKGVMDFMVTSGPRTLAQQEALYAQGRTRPGKIVTWIDPRKGKHLIQPDGFGHAVDLAPVPLDWNDLDRFRELAVVMTAAALAEGVKIAWGGDWETDKDYPHFELATT